MAGVFNICSHLLYILNVKNVYKAIKNCYNALTYKKAVIFV